MKKILISVMSAAVIIGLLGCNINSPKLPVKEKTNSSGPKPPPKAEAQAEAFRAGFITKAMANESHKFLWNEFQRLSPEYNFKMRLFACDNDPQAEATAVEQCIDEGYDVIFVNPGSIDVIVPALSKARDAGIIVGMFSSDLPPEYNELRNFFCGADEFRIGETAAKIVAENFPDGARFVEVGGLAGHNSQIKLHDGFRVGIAGSNIVELDSQNCREGWNANEAMGIMKNLISRFGNRIDVVFCHWDNGASGVIQALHHRGMYDVFVVGIGGNKTGYTQVRERTQALSIGHSFTDMVSQSLRNAKALLEGGSVQPVNHISFDIITVDTIDSLLPPQW